jgi:hypothetical protein
MPALKEELLDSKGLEVMGGSVQRRGSLLPEGKEGFMRL